MIGECRLDAGGLATQRDRYRELGRHVTGLTREPRRLVVGFDDAVDERLLAETVEIERGCCPFFALEIRPPELVVSVGEREHEPALEAIAHALT